MKAEGNDDGRVVAPREMDQVQAIHTLYFWLRDNCIFENLQIYRGRSDVRQVVITADNLPPPSGGQSKLTVAGTEGQERYALDVTRAVAHLVVHGIGAADMLPKLFARWMRDTGPIVITTDEVN